MIPAPEPDERWRERALRALRIYFATRRWPRTAVSVILLLTGGIGFLASYMLLRSGMDKMWARYPLATLIGWIVFVGLMRVWAEIERRCLPHDLSAEEIARGEDPGETLPPGRDISEATLRDLLDVSSNIDTWGLDAEEGCVVSLVGALVFTLLIATFACLLLIIANAPVLLAEVFLDTVLVAALYKRIRAPEQRWWFTGIVRRTWAPALVTALMLMLAGFLMSAIAPEAKSIGGFIRHLQQE